MQTFVQFIKEWVPSIGVIIAGSWILFKWLYEEKIRQRKEVPSLDGKLTTTFVVLDKDKKLVTIEALWNNRSPFSIYMDLNMSRIDIYKIPAHLHLDTPALTLKKDLGEPICSYKFLLHMVEVDYFLEPNSQSSIISHFVLPDALYGARMIFHTGKKGIMWWKEIIINTYEHS